MCEPTEREQLLARIDVHQREIEALRERLRTRPPSPIKDPLPRHRWPLKAAEYQRYGRQMIMPEVGLHGQISLRNASVLVVGLGGLGCPAAAYLAGAGVGVLGLMDGDVVEISNLHRQILHSDQRLGMYKVDSAEVSLKRINPLVRYRLYREHLSPESAPDLFAQYDIILDCTDRPMSRYLVSDAAVCAGKPLISGAALRSDGQLYVLNQPPFLPDSDASYQSGPCYRCVHPVPPPPEFMVNCSEGGVMGPVVGTIGILMATEAIKLLLSRGRATQRRGMHESGHQSAHSLNHLASTDSTMLVYSAFAMPPFRSVKIRGRRKDCIACSADPSHRAIDAESLRSGDVDYGAFCGQNGLSQSLPADMRMNAKEFATLRSEANGEWVLLIDTRDETQFDICSIPGSINIPLEKLENSIPELVATVEQRHVRSLLAVCRLGNDSQMAAQRLKNEPSLQSHKLWIGDIQGGLQAWRREVDPEFPDY